LHSLKSTAYTMPSAIDMTGQKYGRLTAIGIDTSTGKRLWRFACDCGTEKTINAAMVRSGKTSSCGCLRRETTASNRFRDLHGLRVGRLLVLHQLDSRNSHGAIQWACACDCGEATVMTTGKLRKKNPTLSCGCLQREFARALGASSKQENPASRTPEYRAAQRKKRRERPEQAMAERVSRLMAWALASVGAIKSSATFELLGYTPTQLKAHIEKQFTQGMSWDNRSEWELDHITPISTATCEADVIALNQLSNLRPLWADQNNRKNSRRHFLI
jgi:hypothetical protein